ncbi:MAG TPA: LuxR C-terminal-related transcriptional regulator [Allosphingosinicella sp.]
MLAYFDAPCHAVTSLPSKAGIPPRLAASRPVRIIAPSEESFPVYLVEPERGLRVALARDLSTAGFVTRPFGSIDDLAEALPELAPGCVVLDIAAIAAGAPALREGGGEGAARFPTILTFTSVAPEDAVAAIRFGAADLLRRPIQILELLAALRRVAPRVRELELRLAARRAREVVDTLTPRQREILECIMRGLSNKEIARVLDLSPRTIEMHRARLHRRLSAASLAELLSVAWRARAAGSG